MPRARVVFLLKLKPGSSDAFLAGYEQVRHEVATGVPGHIEDQVCQDPNDEDSWVITSEWDDLEQFLEWERTEEHRDLVKPMRECFAEARSLKYVVRRQTSKGVSEDFD